MLIVKHVRMERTKLNAKHALLLYYFNHPKKTVLYNAKKTNILTLIRFANSAIQVVLLATIKIVAPPVL
jgi:hypothetical protein